MRLPNKTIIVGVLLVGMVLVSVAIYFGAVRQREKNLEAVCAQIADWARHQPLDKHPFDKSQLPASLANATNAFGVNVVITHDGRIVVLLKTNITYKMNYTGVLYSTGPIDAGEITLDSYGRQQIDIPEIDINPPLINKKIKPTFYGVFFDLG